MHSKQLDEVQQMLGQLLESMTQAQQAVGTAVERLTAVREAVQLLAFAPPPDKQESLAYVQTLTAKQQETLQAARERGKGVGLQKTLDTAEQIGHQQKELVERAMAQDGPNTIRDTLARFRDLQQQEYRLLQDELGKFEAQGMRELLDELLALGKQQEELVQQLLERRSLTGA